MAFSFGKFYKPRTETKTTPPEVLEPRPNRLQNLSSRVVRFFNRKRKKSLPETMVSTEAQAEVEGPVNVIPPTPSPTLEQFYILKEIIGEGAFSKVRRAVHKSTRESVAVKIIQKQAVGYELPRINKEVDALSRLDHPYICQLYQIFETDETVYIVMELCKGGELFDEILQYGWINEEKGRIIFRQLVSAVRYVHDKGITHGDLKPENVLLDEFGDVKLIDFNLCSMTNAEYLTTFWGTIEYTAPELLRGDGEITYDGRKTDAWSLGVFLYVLLCGSVPFSEPNIGDKIMKCQYSSPPRWLSSESSDLIDKLLVVEPRLRLSLENILHHPWLNCKVAKSWSEESIASNKRPVKVAIPPQVVVEGYVREELDEEILTLMSGRLKLEIDKLKSAISSFKFDNNILVTYLLLLQKKRTLFQPALDRQIIGWNPKSTECNRSFVASI